MGKPSRQLKAKGVMHARHKDMRIYACAEHTHHREAFWRWWWCGGGGGAKQGSNRRGGGLGTQKFVYQQGPDKIFPFVNFVSHDGHCGLRGESPPPPPLLRRCRAILILPWGRAPISFVGRATPPLHEVEKKKEKREA